MIKHYNHYQTLFKYSSPTKEHSNLLLLSTRYAFSVRPNFREQLMTQTFPVVGSLVTAVVLLAMFIKQYLNSWVGIFSNLQLIVDDMHTYIYININISCMKPIRNMLTNLHDVHEAKQSYTFKYLFLIELQTGDANSILTYTYHIIS